MFSCIYLYFDVITKDQIRCGFHLNILTSREQLEADLGICSDKHLQISNGWHEVIVKTWLFRGHEKTSKHWFSFEELSAYFAWEHNFEYKLI